MKFREHRGGYAESMATAVDLTTKEEFIAHLGKVVRKYTQDAATVRFSDLERIDSRNGWRTFYVILDGSGPIGMIDGPPPTSWWPPIKFERYEEPRICICAQGVTKCPAHGEQPAERELCPLCGAVLGYCMEGEYCTKDDCRYAY